MGGMHSTPGKASATGAALEAELRTHPGYLERLERKAADPDNTVRFIDWENPTAGTIMP